jgi:hypothetical protein
MSLEMEVVPKESKVAEYDSSRHTIITVIQAPEVLFTFKWIDKA